MYFFYLCVEEPGFIGFDSPIDNDSLDNNFPEDFNQLDEPLEENVENYETYHKNVMDMKKHEENQLELVREIKHHYINILLLTLYHR